MQTSKDPTTSSNPTSLRQSSTEASTGPCTFESRVEERDIQPSLILVGTVHLQWEARSELSRLLHLLKPAAVTVEISPFSVAYRGQHEARWIALLEDHRRLLPKEQRNHPRVQLLERQIRLPFEWAEALAFGKRRGIPVVPVDTGELARKELPRWEDDLLSKANLLSQTACEAEPVELHIERRHAEAKRILSEPWNGPQAHHPLRWLGEREWEKRERLLAQRVRRIHRIKRPLVHIGGWMHMVIGSPWLTLADRLCDLSPMRILLSPVDSAWMTHST
ncbi:MAG: hypothetical protein K6360_05605 [Deltaproteobacteria bacterium]